jgi:hypothetical protein
MTDLALLGLGGGIGIVGSMVYLIIKLRDFPVNPILHDDVKRAVRNAALVATAGGLILMAGCAAGVAWIAVCGVVPGLGGIVGVGVAGSRWRQKTNRLGPSTD